MNENFLDFISTVTGLTIKFIKLHFYHSETTRPSQYWCGKKRQ